MNPKPSLPRIGTTSGFPIKVSIASVVVLAMLVLAIGIFGLGWQGAKQSLLDTAAKTAQDAGQLIVEKSHRLLEPAQATLRLLATTSLVQATTLDERLKGLETLSGVLTSNSLASAVFIGYADGAFLLVRPLDDPELRKRFESPPKSNFLIQSVEVQTDGSRVGEFLFFNAGLELLERRVKPDYQFDPRTRPWYQTASQTDASLSSAPYVFFTTQQVGLTLSQSSTSGQAVFGIDVVIDQLASSLADLKMSKNAQLALLDDDQKVMAYPDMQRVLIKTADKFDFKTLDALGVPSLIRLNALGSEPGKVATFDVDGQEWLGVVLPFDMWTSGKTRLLVAAPSDDLLGDLKAKATRLGWLVALFTLLLMPFGWLAGAAIGRNLDRLTAQAQRISQFDFKQRSSKQSLVREVNSLSMVMDEMGQTIQTFLQISQDMATEPKVERMLDSVLANMVSATRCTAGAVYLWDHTTSSMVRHAETGDLQAHGAPQPPYTAAAAVKEHVYEVVPDVMELQVELRGRSGKLDGLLVLQHPADAGHAAPMFIEFVRKLSGMLAVSIETRQLIASQKALLDAVIRLMADAIDAKSPYTGGHCERVPELAGMLVDHMGQDTTGPYASFKMNEDERYEFHLAAWLHDCGKVTSPEHIIDKATKLEAIYNRIGEVRMRFEVLWRDAELDYWKALAAGGDAPEIPAEKKAELHAALLQRQQALTDDFAFVACCNVGGEFMAEADLVRLKALAGVGWLRHFDNRLGLSGEESRRMGPSTGEVLPAPELLLADRPDHVVPWGERKPAVEKTDPKNKHGFDMVLPRHMQNMGELYNLSIRRGTLTDEDRFKINDHIVQTLVMLRSLPWPAQLAKVPDIAATHHEKLDGKGYPRCLPATQLTVADRVMAVADIFEALTAADRPYKSPKTLTESLKIMAFMAKDQHIDAELFRYFLHSRLWQVFADKFMLPNQIDVVDVAAIERLLPAPASAPAPEPALS
jgi:HD-GYP domain-containing protein (c-di-GMP phosphodiesterase class II)